MGGGGWTNCFQHTLGGGGDFFYALFYKLFFFTKVTLYVLADTRVNHTGVLAVGNYLGSSLAVGI